ncbi:MAG: LysR family positive regulator for ilvC [Saprospiraceae bacterium]|jgi:LysR family positive regulator for ilvC
MNPRLIKQFISLAEHLHFGRASDACHISSSALSRNIRQLEEELDTVLFDRDNRSVNLTQEGDTFLQYARDATLKWKGVLNELNTQSGELRGKLKLYCSVTAAYSILFDLLNRFRDDHPGIDIKLHTGDPEHAIDRILAGHEDISIAAHPKTLPKNIAFKPITVSPLLFIAPMQSKDLRFNPLPPVSVSNWEQIPMILAEGGIARKRTDAWFKQQGISPKIYAQVTGNEAIVSMVSLGLGVGVVPKIVIDHSPMADNIQVLDVTPKLEPYNVGLFALKKQLKNPLLRAFWG